MNHRWLGVFMLLAAAPLAPAAPTAADDARTWQLRGRAVEAAVTLDPPRIVKYGPAGGPNLLFTDPVRVRSGVRFIALEEVDGRLTSYAFDAPGEFTKREDDRAAFRVISGEGRVELNVEVVSGGPGNSLGASCILTNTGPGERRLALWAIASVPPSGTLLAPISRGIEQGRRVHGRVVSYWSSALNAPGLELGAESLALHLEQWPGAPSVKYGTRSNAGWIAAARPDLGLYLRGGAMLYAPGDAYPDEDCNVQIWAGGTPEKVRYAEMEWLSAWHTLPAGHGSLQWLMALEIHPLDAAPGQTGADQLLETIRKPGIFQWPEAPQAAREDARVWAIQLPRVIRQETLQRATTFRYPPCAAGELVAKAPLLYNAPAVTDFGSGPVLMWSEDTLVEAVPGTIPAWDVVAGRQWIVEFREGEQEQDPTQANDPGRRLLLQDGDRAAGFALYLEGSDVIAALWSGAEVREVRAPLPEEKARVRVELAAGGKTLQLALKDAEPVIVPVPFTLDPPARRIGIARNAQWPESLEPRASSNFTGRIYRLEIVQPVAK